MPDPVERYLDEVCVNADLVPADETSVRAELKDHLDAICSAHSLTDQKEIYAMLENEFGRPSLIGRKIAKAKGRFRTYLKRKRRTLPYTVTAALILGLAVRWAVAESFYVPSDAAAPEIPQNSRVLVYKLARSFAPGDVIVFRHNGTAWVGIVKGVQADGLVVTKHNRPDQFVSRDQVVGRVFLNTR